MKRQKQIPMRGDTIPHRVDRQIRRQPRDPGAGRSRHRRQGRPRRPRRAELCGIHNILTKVHGSTNPINLVKATIDGLLAAADARGSGRRLRGVTTLMDLSTTSHMRTFIRTKRKKRVGRGVGSGHGKTAPARQQGPVGQRRRQETERLCSKAARCRCSAASPSAASATLPGTRRLTSSTSATLSRRMRRRDAEVTLDSLKAGGAKGTADGSAGPRDGEFDEETGRSRRTTSRSRPTRRSKPRPAARLILIPAPKKPVRNKMKPRPPKPV